MRLTIDVQSSIMGKYLLIFLIKIFFSAKLLTRTYKLFIKLLILNNEIYNIFPFHVYV